MKRNISIVDFVTDPQLLGLSISKPQETLLRSIYGLALTKSMLDIWQLCTGREIYTKQGFSEATIICGARSGKDSRIATPTAAFEAALGNHDKYLAKGEKAVIPLVRLCKNPFVYSDYSWVSDHTSAKSVSQRLKISFLVAINTSRARWWS